MLFAGRVPKVVAFSWILPFRVLEYGISKMSELDLVGGDKYITE